jgi:hypothetical protein
MSIFNLGHGGRNDATPRPGRLTPPPRPGTLTAQRLKVTTVLDATELLAVTAPEGKPRITLPKAQAAIRSCGRCGPQKAHPECP